jgi:putative oxidoreductase
MKTAYRSDPATMPDTGRLLLRVGLGVLILLHGISKVMNGIGPILEGVEKAGLPRDFGYLVYVGEVVAPILLIVGFLTRPAALVIAINMAFAVYLVHASQLLTLTKQGGWALELQGMYFLAAVVVALLGAGRFSVGGASGRWN